MEKAIFDAVSAAVTAAVKETVPVAVNNAIPQAVSAAISASININFSTAIDQAVDEKVKQVVEVMEKKHARNLRKAKLEDAIFTVCFVSLLDGIETRQDIDSQGSVEIPLHHRTPMFTGLWA